MDARGVKAPSEARGIILCEGTSSTSNGSASAGPRAMGATIEGRRIPIRDSKEKPGQTNSTPDESRRASPLWRNAALAEDGSLGKRKRGLPPPRECGTGGGPNTV